MAPRPKRSFMPGWVSSLLLRSVPLWKGVLVAVVCVLGASIVRIALTPLVGGGVPFITFSPAILIATVWAGLTAGIWSLILASLIAADLWLDPTQRFGGEPWAKLVAFWLLCGLLIIIGIWLRSLMRALSDSEERANMIVFEMTHRMRNVIGLVQAISRQTARNTASIAEYQTMFEGRLMALGRAQELITDNPTVPTDLKALLDRVLEPFGPPRFSLSGVPTGVPHEVSSTLALLFHELGTNSLKYGALSVSEGKILVTWEPEQDQVRVDWRELNGPPVSAPSRTGFGSRLLKTAFPAGRGEASIDYNPDGVQCRMRFSNEIPAGFGTLMNL